MSALKQTFGKLVAPAMLGAMAVSSPAWANGDAANVNDTPVTHASLTIAPQKPTGQDLCLEWEQKAKTAFPVSCVMDMPEHVVQDILEDASTHRFLIGVWGGRDEHRTEAIRVANRMYRDGKTIGIVFGPDKDTHMIPEWAERTVHLEDYAHGKIATDRAAEYGMDHLDKIGGEFADAMFESYELNYPSEVKTASNGGSMTRTPR